MKRLVICCALLPALQFVMLAMSACSVASEVRKPTTAAATTASPESDPSPRLSPILELAGNRQGSPVFGSPRGTPFSGASPRIPYGTKVFVDCKAKNESGIVSVTAFYHIVTGTWKGGFVVADTMTNGGKLGDPNSPNVDPEVPPCDG